MPLPQRHPPQSRLDPVMDPSMELSLELALERHQGLETTAERACDSSPGAGGRGSWSSGGTGGRNALHRGPRRGKSRIMEQIDYFLEGMGLYRKQTARDGTCLFRCVSEQVLSRISQIVNLPVTNICLNEVSIHYETRPSFSWCSQTTNSRSNDFTYLLVHETMDDINMPYKVSVQPCSEVLFWGVKFKQNWSKLLLESDLFFKLVLIFKDLKFQRQLIIHMVNPLIKKVTNLRSRKSTIATTAEHPFS